MNLLRNNFLQIYVLFLYIYGKTNESGKTDTFTKDFFSKIEELRNYVKKKNGYRNNAVNLKKIKIGLCYGAKLF